MKSNPLPFTPQSLKNELNLSLINGFNNSSPQKTSSPLTSPTLDSFSLSSSPTLYPTYNNHKFKKDAYSEELARLAKKTQSNTIDLKAENNVLTFNSDTFYNITTKDGRRLSLFAYPKNDVIGISDFLTGGYSNEDKKELMRIQEFFTGLSHTSLIRENFERSEVKEIFSSLGVKPGKVDVNVNGNKSSFYLLNDGTVITERQAYCEKLGLTSQNWFDYGCSTESVFIVEGKEYRPDEYGHINLPPDTLAVSETVTYPVDIQKYLQQLHNSGVPSSS